MLLLKLPTELLLKYALKLKNSLHAILSECFMYLFRAYVYINDSFLIIMPPPCVTGKVAILFLRCQLIFRIGGRVIHISFQMSLRVPTFRN